MCNSALYVIILSGIATAGRLDAALVGVAWFVLTRLGAVSAILDPVVRVLQRQLYGLREEDETLRAVIRRAAMRMGVDRPEIKEMSSRLLRLDRHPRARARRQSSDQRSANRSGNGIANRIAQRIAY